MMKKILYTSLFLLSTLTYAQINSVEYDPIRPDDFLKDAMSHIGSPSLSTIFQNFYSNKLQDTEKELKIWAEIIETSPSRGELNFSIKGMNDAIQKRSRLLKKLGKNE